MASKALSRDDNNVPVGWIKNYMSATGATVVVKAAPAILHSITFNKPVGTTVITLYDDTVGTTGTFGIITVPASPQPVTLTYDVVCTAGLAIIMSVANSDITISYI